MDRQIIEDKDRDVVKKFRSVVDAKELKKKQQRSRINIVAALLVAGCAALLTLFVNFSHEKHSIVSKNETQTENFNKTSNDLQALPGQEGKQIAKQVPSQKSDSGKKTSQEPTPPQSVPVQIKAPQFPKNTKEIKASSLLVTPEKKISPKPSKKNATPNTVQIMKILTCTSVKDRQHISSQKEFSVKKDSRVYVWMDVRSKKTPQTLKLIYNKNGHRYRAIPLSIKHAEMRTWSYISLSNLGDVGKWRVDVITGAGETVSNIEFTVVP